MGIIHKNVYEQNIYDPTYLEIRLTLNFFLDIQSCIAIIIPDFFDTKPLISLFMVLVMFVNFIFALTYPNKYKNK